MTQPKKDRVADFATAPRLLASALHHLSHSRMPQPAKARRARVLAQLKARERKQRERRGAVWADDLSVGSESALPS